MTPEQHNKYLSWAHFAHAGLNGLVMVLVITMMTTIMSLDPNPPPPLFVHFAVLLMTLMAAVMVVPSILAGYGFRKRKRWAKTMGIAAGVVASMSAPIGTALCVYTFWFLFSEPGKLLYDNAHYALPQGKEAWRIPLREVREHQYVPPPSPPDWR